MKPWQVTENRFVDIVKALYGGLTYVHKFTDSAKIRGLIKGVTKGAVRLGFSEAQPCDFLIFDQTNGVWMADVKHCESQTSFPFSDIQPAQWAACTQVIANGGAYYFMIYAAKKETWFKVPAALVLATEKKSLRWDELTKWTWNIPDAFSQHHGRPRNNPHAPGSGGNPSDSRRKVQSRGSDGGRRAHVRPVPRHSSITALVGGHPPLVEPTEARNAQADPVES